MFLVENGKLVELGNPFLVENGKLVELGAPFLVEGGKLVELAGGGNLLVLTYGPDYIADNKMTNCFVYHTDDQSSDLTKIPASGYIPTRHSYRQLLNVTVNGIRYLVAPKGFVDSSGNDIYYRPGIVYSTDNGLTWTSVLITYNGAPRYTSSINLTLSYKDGIFYLVSSQWKNDDYVWNCLFKSTDLVTWTYCEDTLTGYPLFENYNAYGMYGYGIYNRYIAYGTNMHGDILHVELIPFSGGGRDKKKIRIKDGSFGPSFGWGGIKTNGNDMIVGSYNDYDDDRTPTWNYYAFYIQSDTVTSIDITNTFTSGALKSDSTRGLLYYCNGIWLLTCGYTLDGYCYCYYSTNLKTWTLGVPTLIYDDPPSGSYRDDTKARLWDIVSIDGVLYGTVQGGAKSGTIYKSLNNGISWSVAYERPTDLNGNIANARVYIVKGT